MPTDMSFARRFTAFALIACAACGDTSAPSFVAPPLSDVLAKLTLSDRSLILAIGDTLTLRVAATNFEGNPLSIPDTIPVNWTSSNSRVLNVDANGHILAVAATSEDEYVLAIASWTSRAITQADTAFINVTATRQSIARIQMVSRDSTRSSNGEDIFSYSGVSVFAVDSNGGRLFAPRVQVAAAAAGSGNVIQGVNFVYLGQIGVIYGFGQYLLFSTYIGDYWLSARTRVYGSPMGDSLHFTGLYASDIRIQMQKDSASNSIVSKFSGYEVFLQPCGSVKFENQSGQPIDIVFDDSTKASGCTPFDPTGNIPNIASGETVARKFPSTGTVQWTARSTATGQPLPRLSGKITMKVP